MKNLILVASVFLISITSAQAQWWGSKKVKGNGDMVTKTRTTDSYDEIKLVGSLDVELVAGKEGRIKVAAESNLQEYIVTEVKGNTLKISTKEGVNIQPSMNKSIKITVPFEDIEEVSITGSGDIWNTDIIKGDRFKASVTGSGDLILHLNVKDVEGSVTGSGDIKLKGKSQNFRCRVTGSGDFMAYDLESENVEAVVSGSGDIQVYASKFLKATVSGSGDITYKGKPAKQDFNTSGSGDVESY